MLFQTFEDSWEVCRHEIKNVCERNCEFIMFFLRQWKYVFFPTLPNFTYFLNAPRVNSYIFKDFYVYTKRRMPFENRTRLDLYSMRIDEQKFAAKSEVYHDERDGAERLFILCTCFLYILCK